MFEDQAREHSGPPADDGFRGSFKNKRQRPNGKENTNYLNVGTDDRAAK